MHNKPTLCNATYFFLNILFVIVILVIDVWEHWIRLADNLHWLQFTIFTDGDETPIIKSAFPEFSKVDLDLLHDIILLNDIALLNLMPRQQVLILALDWRWCTESQEYLSVHRLWIFVHDALDNEMLSDTTDRWAECLQQLPVDAIIKHVEEHDGLITDAHVTVTHKLNKKFLDPVQSLSVISNLCNKK
jgi:hypothetical protein